MASIIKLNKWSQEERLNICESMIKPALKVSDALGFNVLVSEVGPGHRQIGFKRRRQGFDLPTVITEAQLLRKEVNELLARLGVKEAKPEEVKPENKENENGERKIL